MEIKISYRQIIVGMGFVQMVFFGLFYYVLDILMNIPVDLGGSVVAISFVQLSMEKSPLSKSWNHGFLIFAVFLYIYVLSSPFMNYEELLGFNLGFRLVFGSLLYMSSFWILSHFAKKRVAALQSSKNE